MEKTLGAVITDLETRIGPVGFGITEVHVGKPKQALLIGRDTAADTDEEDELIITIIRKGNLR